MNISRRSLLKRAAIGGGALGLLPVTNALAETPSQTEGPFHPVNIDTDLVRKGPGAPLAKGQVIQLKGNVKDEAGNALAGVFIELWQADHQGKYAHPSDPLDLTPDADFQFWGRATSNASGNFSFRTIKPSAYPASSTWMRPPHLHFRFSRRGYFEVTTQMYFAGETLNASDLILQELTAAQQNQVVVSFAPLATETRPGEKDLGGFFQVELKKVPGA